MKKSILISMLIALAGSVAGAAEFAVFRVCQDQRVIRTSDGAEAGRVEYIVVDPSNRQVVSTIVSGGVIGERLVAIPYSSMRFTNDREIALTEISRERLVSAPVIERTQINASVIEPTVIERTATHFNVRSEGNAGRNVVPGAAGTTSQTTESRSNSEARPRGEAGVRTKPQSGTEREGSNLNPGAGANPRSPATTSPNAREEGKQGRPGASTERANPRGEKTTPDAATTTERNPRASTPDNTEKNATTNEPGNRGAKAQTERGTPNAQNEAETKRGAKGAAERNTTPGERNATEEGSKTPRGENNTDASRTPKSKAQTPGERTETEAGAKKPTDGNNTEATAHHTPKSKAQEAVDDKRKQEPRP